ncbi:MAG: T9SS C-terminal target domain-containing protein [Bacteroidetes bacterium]|nr:MAG: T9SS C-terminal target domain-containing protein [Bacteroidota bacterium]
MKNNFINFNLLKIGIAFFLLFSIAFQGNAQVTATDGFEDEGPVLQNAPFKKTFSESNISFSTTGRLKLFGNTYSTSVGANGSVFFMDCGDNTKNPVSGNVGTLSINNPSTAFRVNSFSGYTASDALGHVKTTGIITFTGTRVDGTTVSSAVTITPTNVGTFVQNGLTFLSTPLNGLFFTSLSITLPVGIQYIQIDDFNFTTQAVVTNQFSISDVSKIEGNSGTSTFQFTVTRTDNTSASSVQVQSANGTAVSGTDFVNFPLTTLNFLASGVLTQTVTVTVNGDATIEPNETFTMALSNPTNGVILDGTGIGTILDDDASRETFEDEMNNATTFSETAINFASSGKLKVTNASGLGAGGSNFYLASSLPFATGNQGSISISNVGSAISLTSIDVWTGSNYSPISSNITFLGTKLDGTGTVTHTATVSPVGNGFVTVNFASTSFNNVSITALSFNISNAANNLQIDNIAFTPFNFNNTQVSINSISVQEGTGGGSNTAIFTVSRSNNTTTFSVDVASSNGTATAGSDYTAFPNTTLNFTSGGALTQTVSVLVSKDAVIEPNETFNMVLSNPTNGTFYLNQTGVGTILDDDKICETFEDDISGNSIFSENGISFSSTGRYKVLGINGGSSGSGSSGFYLSAGNGAAGVVGKFSITSPNTAFKLLSLDAWIGTNNASFSSGTVTFTGTLLTGGTASVVKTVTSTSNSGTGWQQNITFLSSPLDNVLLTEVQITVQNPITVLDLDNICYSIENTLPVLTITDASSNSISNNGAATLANNTDFGSACLLNGFVNKTYIVRNTGSANLSLSGLATLGGADAAQFSITTQPLSVITANGTSQVVVRYDPSSSATHNATITFSTNDSNNNPFVINIKGVGNAEPVATITSALASCQNSSMNISVQSAGAGATYVWSGNGVVLANSASTTATPTLSGNQTYNVTVTNVSGCTATGTSIVAINPITQIVTQPINKVTCTGFSSVFIVSATGTSLSYLWNTNATTNTITSNIAGSYSVTVSGTCGNAVSNTVTNTLNPLTSIAIQPVSQTVCGGNLATFSVSASGTSLSYLWNTNATTNTITSGLTENYTVTVSGTCGAPVVSNTVSNTVSSITSAISSTNLSCNNVNNGTATVVASGGLGSLSYNWNTGPITNSIAGLGIGTYTVTVMDAFLCTKTHTATLTQPTALNLSLSNSTNVVGCSDGTNGRAVMLATGGTFPYSFFWDRSSSTVATATGLATGTHLVTVTDANLCKANTGLNISRINQNPIVAVKNIVVTLGGNGMVSVSGADVDNGSTDDCSIVGRNLTNPNFVCGQVGANSVTLLVTDNDNAVSAGLATVTIVDATPPMVVTQNALVTLSASGVANITPVLINNGSSDACGIQSLSVFPTSFSCSDIGIKTVTLTGTDINGNISKTTATVTVQFAVPTIETQPQSTSICSGGSPAQFSVSASGSNLTYTWSNGLSATNTMNTNIAGSYTVTVSGTCGKVISDVATLSVVSSTSINTQPSSQTICGASLTNFSANALGVGLSYAWSNGQNTQTMQTSIAGIYDVTVTGTCGTTVSNQASLTINENNSIITQPTSRNLCEGVTASFVASVTGTNISYLWNTNETTSSIQTTIAGNYTVTVTGSCGIEVFGPVSLSTIPSTMISTQPTSQTSCAGSNISFAINASGDNLSYTWSNGLSSTNVMTTNLAGSYTVTVSGTCGTQISNAAVFTANPLTTITSAPTSQVVCPNASATLGVTATGTGILSYLWNTNETTASISTSTVASDYQVTVTGRCGIAISNQVAVSNAVSTQILSQTPNQTLCGGNTNILTITADGTNLAYIWNTGSTTSSIGTNLSGNYAVTVSGVCGMVSTTIDLTLNQATAIVAQPLSQSLINGTANLTVSAIGTNLSYLWNTGETTTSIVATTTGSYTVTVSGLCGTSISNAASITNLITATSTATVLGISTNGNILTITSPVLITINGTGFTNTTNVTINGVSVPVVATIGTNVLLVQLPVGVITSTSVVIQVQNPNQLASTSTSITIVDGTLISTNLPIYQSTNFSIYPNPTSSGEWRIENGVLGATMFVFNAQGAIVYTQTILSTTTEVSTKLSSGIYLIKVGNASKKLVVE